MKLKKFGSLHLDTPRISYEFYKFASKSRKTIKENIKTLLTAKRSRRTTPRGADS